MTKLTNLMNIMTAPTIFGGDIFEEAFKAFGTHIFDGPEPYNVFINEDGNTILEFALVGFDKKDINISLQGQKLIVEAKQDKQDDEKQYVHRKICQRSIRKVFDLSDRADIKSIKSNYKNGLLTVIVPVNKKDKEVVQIKVD